MQKIIILIILLLFWGCNKKSSEEKTLELLSENNKIAYVNCKKAVERIVIIADKQNMDMEFTKQDEEDFSNCVFNYNQKVIDCVMSSVNIEQVSKCNLLKINIHY